MQVEKMGEAKRLLLMQLAFCILLPVVLLPMGKIVVFSGFLGGLIAVSSSLIMLLGVFRKYTAQQPEKILANIYTAEISKLIFTVAAFAMIVLTVKPISYATLLIVYFIIQVVPAIFLNYR